MSDEKLREHLEELHLELLKMSPAEKSLQDKRDALAAQIRESLDQPDLGGFHLSLKEILEEELVSFEATHPKITLLISKVTDMLNSMGI